MEPIRAVLAPETRIIDWGAYPATTARLAAIVDSSDDAILSKDLNGIVRTWNRGAERLFGYAPDEAVGQSVLLVIPPERAQEEPGILARIQRGERIEHYETVRRRKDGTLVNVSLSVSPIHDAEGRIVGASSIARDVTGHKRAEEALRRSEARLQAELADTRMLQQLSGELIREENVGALYEKILDAAVAIMRSDFGSMQMFHPERGERGELRLLAQRGFTAEAARFWEWVRPDSACGCGMAFKTLSRAVVADIPHCEAMMGTPDQQAYAEIGMQAMQSTPLISRSGKLLGMISTHWRLPHQPSERDLRLLDIVARQAADLIERRQSEEQIRRLNDQLSADLDTMTRMHQVSLRLVQASDYQSLLVEILDAAIAIAGTDMGNIQLLEGADLKVVAQRGFGKAFLDFFQTVRVAESACGAALECGACVVVEDVGCSALFAGKPSLEVMLEAGARAVQSTPLISRSGKVLGVFSTHWRHAPRRPTERERRMIDLLARQAADLIERWQTEQSLREIDERKNQFLATLAHELRNPLAPIRNGLHVLRKSGSDSKDAERVWPMMERQFDHMVRLVDDLMEVSRITRGKIELRKERLSLAQVIQDAVEASRPQIEAAGHALHLDLPGEPLFADADPLRLSQVVGNLLNNAAKYTERAGQIRMSLRPEGAEAVISVRDTGIGIPADMLSKIFDVFVQAHSSYDRAQGGLGIGLTLVRSLVELHGGSVEALSAGPGKGSEFIVRLPLARAPQGSERIAGAATPRPLPATRRVLVLDDQPDSATMLGMLLSAYGLDVKVTTEPREALEAFAEFRPAVMILDLGMPQMDGIALARRIRERPDGRSVTLIALTGWGLEQDRRRCKEAGIDHHLVKPVDFDVLQQLLAEPAES